MNYQDIHLEDEALWNQLQTAWEQDDYTTALNVLKNASLSDKQLNAAVINVLTTELLRLQSQADTGFKQDKIVVSAEPPVDLADGKVYFRLIGPATGFDTDSYYIQITQKSGSSYVDLNPETMATDTMLTPSVSQQYFKQQGVSLDEALNLVGNSIISMKSLTVTVYGPNRESVEFAKVVGLDGDPLTNSNGVAAGSLKSYILTIVPPYIDWQPKTVDVSTVTESSIVVRLEKYSENTILRFTESDTVVFSRYIKNVDICCVGGGGGATAWFSQYQKDYVGYGGGGGAISNGYNITPTIKTSYPMIVGVGGVAGESTNNAGNGGTTSFMSVSAVGGGGAYLNRSSTQWFPVAGSAGLAGCGDGGNATTKDGGSNTTISEFNDGSTFYSGGGGRGGDVGNLLKYGDGGLPNGARGGITDVNSSYVSNATVAGVGGGGGGGSHAGVYNTTAYPSSGGSGLVAIKLHYN